jgi:hypothetical protein
MISMPHVAKYRLEKQVGKRARSKPAAEKPRRAAGCDAVASDQFQ